MPGFSTKKSHFPFVMNKYFVRSYFETIKTPFLISSSISLFIAVRAEDSCFVIHCYHYLRLTFFPVWPLETPSKLPPLYLQHTPIIFEHFLTLWYKKKFQSHLVHSLSQPWHFFGTLVLHKRNQEHSVANCYYFHIPSFGLLLL